MSIKRLLIANRGEISIRIARAAAEMGITSVAIFSEDDAASLHVRQADEAHQLQGIGSAAYLDMEQILALALAQAQATSCDAIHPGYGFLSENAQFARRCAEQGILFVGPQPEVLALFGDKSEARALAQAHQVAVVTGTVGAGSLAEIGAFLESLGAGGALMIKALSGGGGRGMRAVYGPQELAQAYALCQSEALASFGNGAVYAEKLVRNARHIEVQIVGDGSGQVSHLGERECTLQRRHQKLIEIAPSPTLSPALRQKITTAAVRLAQAVNYCGLGTFEFLLDADDASDAAPFTFMEANPRLQVEHTVTEEVSGVDLVKTQIHLANGATLAQLGLTQSEIMAPRGLAMQLRINMETLDAAGVAFPAGGTLTVFEPPSGPGIRVDSYGYSGYQTSPNFDSLLAKLIVHVPSSTYSELLARAYRALCEFRIEGVATNIALLQSLLGHPDVAANRVNTRFVEQHIGELLAARPDAHQKRYFDQPSPEAVTNGADVAPATPANTVAVTAPMHGSLVAIEVAAGTEVHTGQPLAVLEAMKMQHVIKAELSGIVHSMAASKGAVLLQGQPLLFITPAAIETLHVEDTQELDLDHIRADLAEVQQRHASGLDALRPDAVARRRKTGQRTARENVADLCDADSFNEYGALAVAAQRTRRSLDELIRVSPADGLIAGIGSVNGQHFGAEQSRCMVLAYDYTVFAGTQGAMNHKKTDRMLQIAQQWRLPIVFFAEGGGGRPGDVDTVTASSLDVMSFFQYAQLSGLVPRIGIVSGRCFAGNAAFLGCSDVIIATEHSTIGMGGPAMIEGGGLGVFTPEQVGPTAMQSANGVIDIVVADDQAAVHAARQYLSYFQGTLTDWQCADQRLLRQLIPENRLRVYDIRRVIETMADTDSVLELRRQFGLGIITALIRIEGRPFGLIANNPAHLGGAIDADAADKAARFMQLCDAFDLPILSLCDTPGFMVGPAAEQTAMVRHVSRLFVTAASLSVPFFTMVLRKGYGLGAQAMAGGSFHSTLLTAAWPSAEFGAMGIEGAVTLGFRKELEAVKDPQQRQQLFGQMVAQAYDKGKAISVASFVEIDAVIDPVETRHWLLRALQSTPAAAPRSGKKRAFIDTW